MTARTSGRPFNSVRMSKRRASISSSKALRLSGLLLVMTATGPFISSSTLSVITSPSFGGYALLRIPGHARCARASGSAQLAERLILVAAWLAGKSEHPLPQRVALDVVGAAPESRHPLVQERRLPDAAIRRLPGGQHPVG